jgi:hypothetical protein
MRLRRPGSLSDERNITGLKQIAVLVLESVTLGEKAVVGTGFSPRVEAHMISLCLKWSVANSGSPRSHSCSTPRDGPYCNGDGTVVRR